MPEFNIVLIIGLVGFLIIPPLYGITQQELKEKRKKELKQKIKENKKRLQAEYQAQVEANRLKNIEKRKVKKEQENFRQRGEKLQAQKIQKQIYGACLRKKNLTEEEANKIVDWNMRQNNIIYYYKCNLCSSFHMSRFPVAQSEQEFLLG